jgi:hypothetical protein
VEDSCEHGNVSYGSLNFGKFLSNGTIDGFSRRAQLHEVSSITIWKMLISTVKNAHRAANIGHDDSPIFHFATVSQYRFF